MADINVTNTNIAAEYSAEEVIFNAATEDTAGTAQKFVITQTRADAECAIAVDIRGAASGKGGIKIKFDAGDIIGGAQPQTVTVAEGKTAIIRADGRIKNSDGKITVTLEPEQTTSKLKTDLATKVAFIQSCLTR